MCELTQAGGQNNPKTRAERKRVNLFHCLANLRIPKQHRGSRDPPVEMPGPSGAVQSWQAAGLLFAGPKHMEFTSKLWPPLCPSWPRGFGLSHRTGSSSMSIRGPSNLCKRLCYLHTEILFLKTKDKYLLEFPLPSRFPSLIFSKPWYSQLQGHLSSSASLFAILQLLIFSSQQHKTSLFSKASLILTSTLNRNLPNLPVNWKTSWIPAAELCSKFTGPGAAIIAPQFKCWSSPPLSLWAVLRSPVRPRQFGWLLL